MKEKLRQIVDNFHKYNSEHMAELAFGLRSDIEYDALVIAPSFSPYKLHMENDYKVTTLKEGAYIAGYLVETDNAKIAWIKIGASAGNLIDHFAICSEISFKKAIFIGAVGALKPGFELGDICTPSYSISGSYADAYLMKDSIRGDMRFEKVYPDLKITDNVIELGHSLGYEIKKGSVFCTPSIALEYTHLEEIKSFDADLIEMETSSFYLMTELMEVPGVALLVVSDNSATGAALVGRTEEEQVKYDKGRNVDLPNLIVALARK
jgi:purine-nucleoside phosphorylase